MEMDHPPTWIFQGGVDGKLTSTLEWPNRIQEWTMNTQQNLGMHSGLIWQAICLFDAKQQFFLLREKIWKKQKKKTFASKIVLYNSLLCSNLVNISPPVFLHESRFSLASCLVSTRGSSTYFPAMSLYLYWQSIVKYPMHH